jgi:hypothetical protein
VTGTIYACATYSAFVPNDDIDRSNGIGHCKECVTFDGGLQTSEVL